MNRTCCRPVVLLASLSLLCAGCTNPQASPEPHIDTPTGDTTVTKGNIISVMTFDATVQPQASAVYTAQHDGPVTWTKEGYTQKPEGQEAHVVSLPSDVKVLARFIASGKTVPKNTPLFVARRHGFTISATIPVASLYRFYNGPGETKAIIKEGPGPFPCQVMGSPSGVDTESVAQQATTLQSAPAPETTPTPKPGETPEQKEQPKPPAPPKKQTIPTIPPPISAPDAGITLHCIPETDAPLFPGSQATMAVTTGKAIDVLTLPIEAVSGLTDHGEVTMTDGTVKQVKLGITDGVRVEIIEGLSAGDTVKAVSPQLLTK